MSSHSCCQLTGGSRPCRRVRLAVGRQRCRPPVQRRKLRQGSAPIAGGAERPGSAPGQSGWRSPEEEPPFQVCGLHAASAWWLFILETDPSVKVRGPATPQGLPAPYCKRHLCMGHLPIAAQGRAPSVVQLMGVRRCIRALIPVICRELAGMNRLVGSPGVWVNRRCMCTGSVRTALLGPRSSWCVLKPGNAAGFAGAEPSP